MHQALGRASQIETSGDAPESVLHQSSPTSPWETAKNHAVDEGHVLEEKKIEEMRQTEEIVVIDGSREASGMEDLFTESDSSGKQTPDGPELLHLLAGEELPDRDDEDADYVPTEVVGLPPSRSKRRRRAQADSNEEGIQYHPFRREDDDVRFLLQAA